MADSGVIGRQPNGAGVAVALDGHVQSPMVDKDRPVAAVDEWTRVHPPRNDVRERLDLPMRSF
jgi:hypothetical protein